MLIFQLGWAGNVVSSGGEDGVGLIAVAFP
jgi:hypothetical protein